MPAVQTLERLGAAELAAVVTAYRDVLRWHEQPINRLNVYPVPDGDTGTNMARTLDAVVDALPAGADDVGVVADAITLGSLMGARGNSGVILSQILRGLAAAARDHGGLDGRQLAEGLGRASAGAYQAVEIPVEGTILTVARGAAEAAAGACDAGLVAVAEAAAAGAGSALASTPDLLPVLRQAGVVDSGGAGLVLLFDAFLHVADGRELPRPEPGLATAGATPAAGRGVEVGDCRYEVMYLLEAPDEAIPSFREVWAGIGESIVVVGGDGIYNCHIHTDEIGAAVEAGLDAGRPRQIRVTDLREEVEEERWVREAASQPAPPPAPHRVDCAVVAVCSGDGVRRIFHSLGVSTTLHGGQSMNPSTAELLGAIEEAPADQVVVLPNNKNIVAVAEAAAEQSAKTVRVVGTRTIPEGFAALLSYDPEGDADGNAVSMLEGASRVVAGEVTRAVRDTMCEVGPVAVGDYIGLCGGGIRSVAGHLADAATDLLEVMIDPDHHDMVTVIAGEGSTPADTRRITTWLEERHPDVQVEAHLGGQPLYPYLFGVE